MYQGLSSTRYLNMEQTNWPLASLLRGPRMTPFWRTVGNKPIGAYCQQGLECTTRVCRKGQCSYLLHNW
ncbi:unnamed protein product [Ranitomeya imitator]|uniref:Liver-expressed antimicrobial peptide 2 n=1 Tax=Ranitomeya imitator TaxID=111125 RepID=A0ABN9KPT9_9NEOB|nr:unnamed protein product [Ranitomeya imitator]